MKGDINKKLEGNTNDLRLRVGDYRVRFIEIRPARYIFTSSCIAPKRTAEFSGTIRKSATTGICSAR